MAGGMTRMQALQQLGGYNSRGKGGKGGRFIRGRVCKHSSTAFKFPHGGGAREVARRRRQIAREQLRTN